MTPVDNQEGVVQTAQVLLAYLSDDTNSTPNNMLEGVVAGKNLLRGVITGQLVVCVAGAPALPDAPEQKVDDSVDPELEVETDAKAEAA